MAQGKLWKPPAASHPQRRSTAALADEAGWIEGPTKHAQSTIQRSPPCFKPRANFGDVSLRGCRSSPLLGGAPSSRSRRRPSIQRDVQPRGRRLDPKIRGLAQRPYAPVSKHHQKAAVQPPCRHCLDVLSVMGAAAAAAAEDPQEKRGRGRAGRLLLAAALNTDLARRRLPLKPHESLRGRVNRIEVPDASDRSVDPEGPPVQG
jgi:hypothetical protein